MHQRVPPPVYPIVNIDSLNSPNLYIESLFLAGATWVQIRCKTGTDKRFLSTARRAVELSRKLTPKKTVIVNNRVDICYLAEADGVHLGVDDLEPGAVRDFLGTDAIIGLSTHNLSQVEQANKLSGVDYIGFGPVYASTTKQNHAPETGTKLLGEACKLSKLPVVAIGGITIANTPEISAVGIKSIAVISALEQYADLPETLTEIFKRFQALV